MRTRSRLVRIALRVAALLCVLWTFAAPVAARMLYASPTEQPRGAAKYMFYCHLN